MLLKCNIRMEGETGFECLPSPRAQVLVPFPLTWPVHPTLCLCPMPCGICSCLVLRGSFWFLKSSNCWPPPLRGAVTQGFCLSLALQLVCLPEGRGAAWGGLAEHLIRSTLDGVKALSPSGLFSALRCSFVMGAPWTLLTGMGMPLCPQHRRVAVSIILRQKGFMRSVKDTFFLMLGLICPKV